MTKFEIPHPKPEINWGTPQEWLGLAGSIGLAAIVHATGLDAPLISFIASNTQDTLVGIKEVVFGSSPNP